MMNFFRICSYLLKKDSRLPFSTLLILLPGNPYGQSFGPCAGDANFRNDEGGLPRSYGANVPPVLSVRRDPRKEYSIKI